ncbi:MAG: sulfur carrier protein ThiS [Synechococcales cyanobacterium]
MTLWINGAARSVPPLASLLDVLTHLELNPRLIALEYNGEILPRQHWATTVPHDGDRLEIVTMVGGG